MSNIYWRIIMPFFCNFNQAEFQHRFKALRVSHKLSMSNLSFLLNFKHSNSILMLEAGTAKPTIDTIFECKGLFAINPGWLLGESTELYIEDELVKLEKEVIDMLNPRTYRFNIQLPDHYLNDNSRKQLFTLAERANILFCINVLRYLNKDYLDPLDNENMMFIIEKNELPADYNVNHIYTQQEYNNIKELITFSSKINLISESSRISRPFKLFELYFNCLCYYLFDNVRVKALSSATYVDGEIDQIEKNIYPNILFDPATTYIMLETDPAVLK